MGAGSFAANPFAGKDPKSIEIEDIVKSVQADIAHIKS